MLAVTDRDKHTPAGTGVVQKAALEQAEQMHARFAPPGDAGGDLRAVVAAKRAELAAKRALLAELRAAAA